MKNEKGMIVRGKIYIRDKQINTVKISKSKILFCSSIDFE